MSGIDLFEKTAAFKHEFYKHVNKLKAVNRLIEKEEQIMKIAKRPSYISVVKLRKFNIIKDHHKLKIFHIKLELAHIMEKEMELLDNNAILIGDEECTECKEKHKVGWRKYWRQCRYCEEYICNRCQLNRNPHQCRK